MTIKERLIKFAKSKERSVRAFERETGLTIGYINTIRVSIQPDKLQRIASRYPDLNAEWLMTGVGPMTRGGASAPAGTTTPARSNSADTGVFTTPLLPLAAQGGTLNDFVVSIKADDCEKVVSPIKDVDFAMTITGDSMSPDYPNGAQVLIKKVDEQAFIEWGRVYVLDTCNGSVIKEIRKGDDDDSVMCYSLNPDPKYQPFAVKFADIFGMYRVLMCMSLR